MTSKYYGTAIARYERKYTNKQGSECSQFIYIVSETKGFLYGSSYNGRWKYDKKIKMWFQYDNYIWKVRKGIYTQIELESRGN